MLNSLKIQSPYARNRGAVLLIFMLITITAGSALLLRAFNLTSSDNESNHNHQVLKQAKQALIGYAISYADKVDPNSIPGYLPCPDTDGDGLSNAPCGNINQSSIGYLPWQTLGLKPLRDSHQSCLWYAVSGAYKENPAGSLSTDADGQFLLFDDNLNSLNGNNNSNAALAVIYAAGKAIDPQNRSITAANRTVCGSTLATDGINRSQNFLESLAGINNANGSYSSGVINGSTISAIPTTGFSAVMDAGLKTANSSIIFNDTVVNINPTDFQQVHQHMQSKIGERVRLCLSSYYNANGSKLPWPAPLLPPGNPTYNDNASQTRFGRIASNLVNTAADGLSPLWPMDPLQPSIRCFNWSWWPAVRESIFYAIDNSITPIGSVAPNTLTIDMIANPAVILVAGRELGNQSRITGADKGNITNYLETGNLVDSGSAILPPGNENFISSDSAAAFFNDYVCTLTSCP